MTHLIDKDVLIEKLWERRIKHCNFGGSPHSEYGHEDDEILSLINSLGVKKVNLENYNKVKYLLSLSFMHFLDKNRPQGKMCLSNMECADIDKAFDEMDWAKLFRYLRKYSEETQKGEKV